MEQKAEIVARGLRVFACAAMASALAALAGEASLPRPIPSRSPRGSLRLTRAPRRRAAGRRQAGQTGRAARRLRRDAGRLLRLARRASSRKPRSSGLPPAVIDSALSDVAYDPDVIAHDRRQGSFGQDFETFVAKRVTAYRVRKGRQMLIAYAEPLEKIEKRFGVPGPVLVAIWGLETEFGAGLGNYPTFSTLATLAYDCRRADLFREELVDALKLVARGDMQPDEMRGAWAGEIGQTQFMPSTYLKYATSADGGGDRRSGRQFRGRARFDRQFPQGQGLEARPGLPRRRAQFRRAARMERRAGLRQNDRLLRRPAGRVRRAVSRLCDSQAGANCGELARTAAGAPHPAQAPVSSAWPRIDRLFRHILSRRSKAAAFEPAHCRGGGILAYAGPSATGGA